jgi:hypothetical protein
LILKSQEILTIQRFLATREPSAMVAHGTFATIAEGSLVLWQRST